MWIFWGKQKFFREVPKKRSFKNFVKNLAPVFEGLDPLVLEVTDDDEELSGQSMYALKYC